MKDNKIDIIQQKLGTIRTLCSQLEDATDNRKDIIQAIKSGAELIMNDLELLRKCSIDNPDFDWENYDLKSKAFRNED